MKKSIKAKKESTIRKIKPDRQSMGIGKMGRPDSIFVRKFRWTLTGKNHNGQSLDEFALRKVSFDFKEKTIYFSCYEVVFEDSKDIGIHRWLESNMLNENLIFRTFDGCGTEIYNYEFSGLELLSDQSNFDYENSDISERVVKLKYSVARRNFTMKGDQNDK